jgi:multidrug efflux pump subunit AcrA (membrane-fusion protein)
MSKLGGAAALVEMVPEGSRVREGEVIARFDSSKIERDLVKLEADYTLAKSEFESLNNAQLPLQLKDLEIQLAEAESNYEAERQYLEDSQKLLAEDLVSEQELKQQEAKVAQMKSKKDQLQTQIDLTRKYLQPMSVEGARAKLVSTEQALNLARQEIKDCAIKAPASGLVAYTMVHVGGEYRTARVGDSIYRNQPFMAIPDMSNLVAHCYVPESEMARVAPGCISVITPLAYPDLKVDGEVESVGTMAQTMLEKPSWQKFFHVIVGLNSVDDRLRSGMSVTVSVLSSRKENVVQVPRSAVSWEGGEAHCKVVHGSSQEDRKIRVGMANDLNYEVLEGLQPGDRVAVE